MTCKAQQQNDEMFCAICNLRWDINDPEPSPCPWEQDAKFLEGDKWEGALPAIEMEKYEVKIVRTVIKIITFECEADPLLNKMEIARECADQCENWKDNVTNDQRTVIDARRVKP